VHPIDVRRLLHVRSSVALLITVLPNLPFVIDRLPIARWLARHLLRNLAEVIKTKSWRTIDVAIGYITGRLLVRPGALTARVPPDA
jgi:hypothetical protein